MTEYGNSHCLEEISFSNPGIAVNLYFHDMKINPDLKISSLEGPLQNFWQLAAEKAKLLEREYDPSRGSPVFTVRGKYTSRGWTEWTRGFQYGIPLLVFMAAGDQELLEIGRKHTLGNMAPHLSHFGVHDHGFNNLSTFGNLLQAANRDLFRASPEEKDVYRLALKLSGAVQARRWSQVREGGYIYSFNGPHSLFIDTIRTCRILFVAHRLGHRMLDENDREINMLERAITHCLTTAKYSVYYGDGRDSYDVRGRTAHESIFNMNDGNYRCPNSQQGFSAFTTWTRGLSWAMLGFAEVLEFLGSEEADESRQKEFVMTLLKAARATCDFYIDHSALDGIPYWDTGAPDLHMLGDYRNSPADPHNSYEPVDSSAAAIAAQGFIRLGRYLEKSDPENATRYFQAGTTILGTLLSDKYLSRAGDHQGILLHSVYHRPNGWDYVPEGAKIPYGESGMWGDYHMAELCLTAQSIIEGDYYTFFRGIE
jgi:unsaturated chondroitin disaccharide hydrolase